MNFQVSELPGDSSFGIDPANHAAHDYTIGEIIRRLRSLTDEQIEAILRHQRESGLRFGESAIALKLVTDDDVLWALSQQFHYPYVQDKADQEDSELVVAADPFSEHAEAFRELRSQIMFEGTSQRRSVAVVSADHGDGRSYIAANLAIAFSQLGGKTLLVDADMRSPRQHNLFRAQSDGGLSSILAGRAGSRTIQAVPDLPSLYILPVGTQPPNPLELVQQPTFPALMHQLQSKFGFVVVDTPAASSGADWRVIAAACGSALVVGRRNRTKMNSLDRIVASLKKGRVRVSGVVMNDF